LGKFYELWNEAESSDENIRNNAITEITNHGFSYSLPGLIEQYIVNNDSFSFVRLGDGELAILTQMYKSTEDVLKAVPWAGSTGYCGVSVPSMDFTNRMVKSIRNATIVGVFKNDPFNKEVFEQLGFYPEHITHAFENLYLPMRKDFVSLLKKYPPLLIGRRSNEYAKFLKDKINIDIPACIGIESFHEIDDVINKAMSISDKWKWAYICAGCPAVVIAGELDYKHGKVALDLGHSIDNAIHYDSYWFNLS